MSHYLHLSQPLQAYCYIFDYLCQLSHLLPRWRGSATTIISFISTLTLLIKIRNSVHNNQLVNKDYLLLGISKKCPIAMCNKKLCFVAQLTIFFHLLFLLVFVVETNARGVFCAVSKTLEYHACIVTWYDEIWMQGWSWDKAKGKEKSLKREQNLIDRHSH